MALSLSSLEAFERLLEMQIKTDDNPALRRKLAAVRVQIEDAEAALCRQQILGAIQ